MRLFLSFAILFLVTATDARPNFGLAAEFAILSLSSVTNAGNSTVVGAIGTASAAPTAITGFPVNRTRTGQTAANTAAISAYNQLMAEPSPVPIAAELGAGKVLYPGIYSVGAAEITGTLTLDARGQASPLWVFQIASTLTTATSSVVALVNGSSACDVFWAVGSSATLGTNSIFKGTIVAAASISLSTQASVVGALFGTGGAVTLLSNAVIFCPNNTMATPTTGVPTTRAATTGAATTRAATTGVATTRAATTGVATTRAPTTGVCVNPRTCSANVPCCLGKKCKGGKCK